MKTPEQFVNEECAVYKSEALVKAVEARDLELIKACAKGAVVAVNSCRMDGESDLRSARARAEYAILELAATTERKEP